MRTVRRRYPVFILGALLAALPVACAPAGMADGAAAVDASGPAAARLVVTTDFGTRQLIDVVIPLEDGATAMAALESAAQTDTSYGGGFVQSIGGVGGAQGQSDRADWFYYVNGLMAKTGAKDYVLHDGDVEHWDYRPWGGQRGISATLGCFPWAMMNGYGGKLMATIVACDAGFEAEAGHVVTALRGLGVSDVSLVPLAGLTAEQRASCHLVVVAGPDAEVVRGLFNERAKLGWFASVDGSVLRTFSPSGEETEVLKESTGLLVAAQNPWNPKGTGACENVVVLATGCDAVGVRLAAGALAGSHGRFMTWYGAVVEEGGVVRPLPAG